MASSTGLGWRGIHVERARTNGFEARDVCVPHHTFCMVTNSAYSWESKNNLGYRRRTSLPGQILINPAYTPFTHRSSQSKDFIHLTLEPDRLTAVAENHLSTSFGALQRHYNAEDEQLKALILMLMAEAEAEGPNGPLFVESLSIALVIHCIKKYAADSPRHPNPEGGLNSLQFKRAVDYMEAQIMTQITLEDIACEVGMSKFHFSRLFKNTTGTSPYHYLIKLRAEKARSLLAKGEESISEIAYRLNFSDQSHLSRIFKKHFGVTPRAFQRSHQ
ncbi:MAG: AraC family transcriptional regulator [Desulforhopalus sp.]